MRTLLGLLSIVLLAACGDTRGTSDGAVLPGRDGGGPPPGDGAIPPGTDGGSPPGADAGAPPGTDAGPPAPSVAFCVLGCAAEPDCTTASPAFDDDNYTCEAGSCRYTGCVDDAECEATFASADYACRDPGTGVRSCLEGCASSADCGSATLAFDADNYSCDSGICRYLGCNDDSECEATFGAAYGCFEAEPPATPIPIPTARRNCVRRCATAADCATDAGAFGDDNYSCVSGACRYDGCNDDAECRTSLGGAAYVCR